MLDRTRIGIARLCADECVPSNRCLARMSVDNVDIDMAIGVKNWNYKIEK